MATRAAQETEDAIALGLSVGYSAEELIILFGFPSWIVHRIEEQLFDDAPDGDDEVLLE